MTYNTQINDRLRAEFTQFLQIMVNRAKINYIKKYCAHTETVSLEELSDHAIPSTSLKLQLSNTEFDFEVEGLAEAFETLSPRRQQVLQMIFVEGLSPQEVAERICCSVGHVYNEQSLAIKKLGELMGGGK